MILTSLSLVPWTIIHIAVAIILDQLDITVRVIRTVSRQADVAIGIILGADVEFTVTA
ncbi:MAG: hypothetical protein R3B91_10475 [Planctomycetaceae bacterium]